MFTLYGSDEEHIIALKTWWKNHGLSTVFALVGGTIIGLGYLQIQQWSDKRAHQSSVHFSHYIASNATKAPHLHAPYQSAATLVYAKKLLKVHKNKEALTQLATLQSDKNRGIKNTAAYLSALIHIDGHEWLDADKDLRTLYKTPFEPLAQEALGDMSMLQHHYKDAITHYQKASKMLPKNPQWSMIQQTLLFKEKQAKHHVT